jgi:hypothetical protein
MKNYTIISLVSGMFNGNENPPEPIAVLAGHVPMHTHPNAGDMQTYTYRHHTSCRAETPTDAVAAFLRAADALRNGSALNATDSPHRVGATNLSYDEAAADSLGSYTVIVREDVRVWDPGVSYPYVASSIPTSQANVLWTADNAAAHASSFTTAPHAEADVLLRGYGDVVQFGERWSCEWSHQDRLPLGQLTHDQLELFINLDDTADRMSLDALHTALLSGPAWSNCMTAAAIAASPTFSDDVRRAADGAAHAFFRHQYSEAARGLLDLLADPHTCHSVIALAETWGGTPREMAAAATALRDARDHATARRDPQTAEPV